MSHQNHRSLRRNSDLYEEWDRVNYAQRVAEQSKDYDAIQRAKADVLRVYNAMQAERRRMSRNPDSSDEWHEAGRFDAGWLAFNKMIELQMRSLSNVLGRVETMPSRSRRGKISYAVFLKFVDGPKQSLDFLESQYVSPSGLHARSTKNPGRKRTSRRAKSRKRTSRRAA